MHKLPPVLRKQYLAMEEDDLYKDLVKRAIILCAARTIYGDSETVTRFNAFSSVSMEQSLKLVLNDERFTTGIGELDEFVEQKLEDGEFDWRLFGL